MTKEEKQERRKVRHSLKKAARANLSVNARLTMTGKQMRAAADRITDAILAGKNPMTAQRITG